MPGVRALELGCDYLQSRLDCASMYCCACGTALMIWLAASALTEPPPGMFVLTSVRFASAARASAHFQLLPCWRLGARICHADTAVKNLACGLALISSDAWRSLIAFW